MLAMPRSRGSAESGMAHGRRKLMDGVVKEHAAGTAGRKPVRRFLRRLGNYLDRCLGNPVAEADAFASEKAAYELLVRRFRDAMRARGTENVADFYWYHTVDLGNGIVTPGDYDSRPIL